MLRNLQPLTSRKYGLGKQRPEVLWCVQSKTGQAANYTTDVAGKLYTTAKQYVPESAQGTVKLVEDKVSEYGSPVLTTLQDKGGKILQVADSKVR